MGIFNDFKIIAKKNHCIFLIILLVILFPKNITSYNISEINRTCNGFNSCNETSIPMFSYVPLSRHVNITLLTDHNKPFKIAIQVHVYYVDLINEILDYLENIPEPFDILITTNTLMKYNIIKNELEKRNLTDNYIIDFIENRGMDVYPFILQMKKYMYLYDIILHIHTKKSKHSKISRRILNGTKWRNYLYDNLIGSKNLVHEILRLFSENEKLGIVFPEPFEKVKKGVKWGCNYKYAQSIWSKIKINDTLPRDIIFPAGNMFWARTKAIKKLIDIDFKESDFIKKIKIDCSKIHSIERLWVLVAKESGFDWICYNTTLKKDDL